MGRQPKKGRGLGLTVFSIVAITFSPAALILVSGLVFGGFR